MQNASSRRIRHCRGVAGGSATLALLPSRALTGTIQSKVTTESMFEADGKVIQAGRTRGIVKANGASFDIPEVHTWTIRDDKAIAAHFAIDTAGMLRAINATSGAG